MERNTVEIIINSKSFLSLSRQKEIANWIIKAIQPMIWKQEFLADKKTLRSLTNSPPIHMS